MTDKEQNKSEVEQAPTPKDGSTGMNLRGKDRRRFIKRAIIAAPFILTVTSRPVWANTCSISGQMSGNLSDQNYDCGRGCSPGYWKNHQDEWASAYSTGANFDQVFGVFVFGTATLYEVISFCRGSESNPDRVLGFHAVAALQNAAHPAVVDFIYNPSQVIGYVQQVYNGSLPGYNVETLKDHFDMLNNQGSDLCGYDESEHCCDDD